MDEGSVVSLGRTAHVSPDTVGAKALSLVRMAQISLPVPPAFCITVQAYLDHLHRNRLLPPIEEALRALEDAPSSETDTVLSQIRRRIIDAPLSVELNRDVERHLEALGPGPYAVRSSATMEDLPGHSFAGLHDTILGVADLPSCLEAVKKCWASLWTLRAYLYRGKNGFDHLETAMAVIVQLLIPAEASGVVFTANPLTGRPSSIVIESCFGLFGHIPGMLQLDFDPILGGAHAGLYRAGRLDLAEDDIPRLKASFSRVLLRLPLTMVDLYTHRRARAEAQLERFRARNRRLAALDLPRLSTPELAEQLQGIFSNALIDIDLMHLMTTMYALPLVYRLTAAWLGDANGRLAARLFTGLGNLADAEAGLALWRLAHLAHQKPAIERILLSRKPWQETHAELAALPEGREFLEAWDVFLREHGHHCRGELEFYNPRWAESPEYCLDMVRSHVCCIGATDPDVHRRERVQARREAEERCRTRLRNPLKRWLLGLLIRHAQFNSGLRENLKDEAVRLVATGRRILCQLGRRLTAEGTLDRPDDIFFLEHGEIAPLTLGKVPSNLNETIRSRRQEYDRLSSITPPKVIVGTFDPDNFTPDPVDDSVTTLRGIAASPGVVTGQARVILNADTEEHLEPGEILVAPFTDPGWAPYFLPAAAIVMDQGGILSHGSIVACEYGIPAVVNVGPATRIIKTGQTITVDADRGIVYLGDLRHRATPLAEK